MNSDTKLLIVEDDPNSRLLLRTILTKADYEVVEAENGSQALEILENGDAPNLVVCDWMMPDVDGLEVLQHVRKKQTNSYTYFILLTAKIQPSDLAKGLNAGADDYLTKPFNKTELLARITTGLRTLKLQNDLISKSETIKDFAYALTHDLKTPLLALNMTMQQAQDGTYGDMPEKYQGILPKSVDTIRLLLEMCESLLSIATYDQGDLKLERENLRLDKILLECCESLDPLVRAKNISIETDIDNNITMVEADKKEISRLIFNLISNAVKYTPQNGKVVTEYKETQSEVELSVSDSGPGIPDNELDTIFERFHKNKHGRRTIGTGLGLYLCKVITDLHEGSIAYEKSNLGGSKFIVSLPKNNS